MKKVIIIGGGFAGLSAAFKLCRPGKLVSVSLIDRKDTFDFLPMLPDVIGRGINPLFLSNSLKLLALKSRFDFVKQEITSLDLDKKKVMAQGGVFDYDYLVIASGSETNFYGDDNIRASAFKLDSAEDARRISEAVKKEGYDNLVVSGGGYTGIELASNLSVFLKKNKKRSKVIIVERAPSILGPLPQWMKDYVLANLNKLNIGVLVNSAIEKIEGRNIILADARILNNAAVIWVAGVKTAKFIQDLKSDKNPQGRVKVDEYLRLNDNCFVCGDAAYFQQGSNFLRMAVQFAITQGERAAGNIIKSIKGNKLNKYAPMDFGYIIPMANNRSCGSILGREMKGFLPTLLHYFMCIYRSRGLGNKLGLLKNLITR